jgi:hypothetical protein
MAHVAFTFVFVFHAQVTTKPYSSYPKAIMKELVTNLNPRVGFVCFVAGGVGQFLHLGLIGDMGSL